jgi:hypothetical protein
VGGPVLASLRPDHSFYPASSIKVLHHLHAMVWAGEQPDLDQALATQVPVYHDTCSGTGPASSESLEAVLRATMRWSDNPRANAIQDHFGIDAITETAESLVGTGPGTLLAHRFGCGGPANDPANRLTAADLSLVYDRYGSGELLDAGAEEVFAGLMLGSDAVLDAAITAAVDELGLSGTVEQRFRERVTVIYKAGWWETNLSVGGYVSLPQRACGAVFERGYAFAVFVDEADAVSTGFDPLDVVGVVLQGDVEAALATFSMNQRCRPAGGNRVV